MEVICISSDDESDSQKENKTDKFLTNSTESVSVLEKTESSVCDNEKPEQNSLKRKKLQTEDDINILEKKKRLNFYQNTPKVKNKPVSGLCSLYVTKVNLVKSDCNTQPNKKQEVAIEKQLIVKDKKKISYISQDVFPLFISLCLQKCPKYDRTDMNKIIEKLKRRYENLDPTYASSEHFVRYLNEKREAIASDSKQIYVHIEEVMNEMKKRARKKPQVLQNNEIYDAVPSTSYAMNKISANNRVELSYDDDNNKADDDENAHETNRMIKKVLRTMEKCEARIKKLDEEEVDFNEENDSNYIKVERYKQKMVELYRKFCELTGENPDAGRVYLRPKHLNVTRIAVIDQAITNFINSKITRRNQMKRAGALINNLIFPDYRDIFECVNRCNERKNLGLDEDRRKRIAENAFKELGEHLQRVRRNDYWDTFSLYLENTEDPALKDKNLAKKLADNRSEGEKRLAAVFEKYYRKQLERKNQSSEESLSDEEDEDEGENEEEEEEEEEDEEEEEKESIINDEAKIEENLSMTSEKDSGNKEDIDETIKEKRLSLKKSECNISMVNVDHINVDVMDKDISNKAIATSQMKCKTVTIKVLKENDMEKSKNEVKIVNMKTTYKPCNSNIILKNVIGAKMLEDSSACSTTNCTKDLAEVEAIEVSKTITDPATKKVTHDATDTITRFTTKLITGDAAELIAGDAAELITENARELITRDYVELITRDTAELTTEDATGDITEAENVAEVIANKTEMTIENVIGGSIENMSNDEQHEEENKPVLRLRSFAKPPTTWEDSQHKVGKTTQEKASKESNQVKEIVDLTNEGIVKSPPVITKCTVQLGKIVPVVPVKRQTSTLVIPTNSNIISVQNITNNYLKVNTRTGRIIAPVRDIHGPTIIRLPIQSTSQQSQMQNTSTIAVKNDVSLKGKETILHFIPKNSIIISKKSPVQSVSKKTDVSSSIPTTKSK